VVKKKFDSPYGKLALLEVQIDTGRTHQIRVHLSSIGHPVAGDALYGAPQEMKSRTGKIGLARNFLHAAAIKFEHPRTGEQLTFSRELPSELQEFLEHISDRKV
jgi:23S rRNA pseudouridine1911/1915/1917 synthase